MHPCVEPPGPERSAAPSARRFGTAAAPTPDPHDPSHLMKHTTTDNSTSFHELTDTLAETAAAIRPIFLMSREERLATFNRGDMTRDQMFAWAARYPREVPKINGEFAFIAGSTPEACVCCPVCNDDEVTLAPGAVLAKHPDHRHAFDPQNPYAHRPTCPASGVSVADANGMRTAAPAPTAQMEYALAA